MDEKEKTTRPASSAELNASPAEQEVNPTAPGLQAPVAATPLGRSTEPPDVGQPGGGKPDNEAVTEQAPKETVTDAKKGAAGEEVGEYHAMDGGSHASADDALKKAEPAKPADSDFKQRIWQPILRPIVTLVCICLVTSLLLGLTNAATSPVIEANSLAAADEARKVLLPDADAFEEIAVPDGMDSVTSVHKAMNGAGWVIGAWGRGYGGHVPVLVAFDDAGTILGVTFTENSETVGLGQKVRNPEFENQFAGREAANMSLSDIDKIASATISSGAAVNAVNAAVEAYAIATSSGGSTRPTSPEDVRAFLLPGQELTAITLSADGVQSTAYAGANGNYIIYGEVNKKSGDRDSTVIAAVAMDENGTILNLWIDTSGESEQYGQTLMTNAAYLNSFVGQTAPAKVDAIADITNSSEAVQTAVNAALNALSQAKEAA